mmetsp:Transcript_11637/g.35992  ORF Transcript_11637/g.35992 Transcript_11637/m.35992 type:complete len:320 (+) Transcript_11637:180-1139(+)
MLRGRRARALVGRRRQVAAACSATEHLGRLVRLLRGRPARKLVGGRGQVAAACCGTERVNAQQVLPRLLLVHLKQRMDGGYVQGNRCPHAATGHLPLILELEVTLVPALGRVGYDALELVSRHLQQVGGDRGVARALELCHDALQVAARNCICSLVWGVHAAAQRLIAEEWQHLVVEVHRLLPQRHHRHVAGGLGEHGNGDAFVAQALADDVERRLCGPRKRHAERPLDRDLGAQDAHEGRGEERARLNVGVIFAVELHAAAQPVQRGGLVLHARAAADAGEAAHIRVQVHDDGALRIQEAHRLQRRLLEPVGDAARRH